MSVQVRRKALAGADEAADRDFVQSLGRRTVMSSVGSLRRATQPAAGVAFERLCEIVAGQSHVTFIAHQNGERLGFAMLLDQLPDEVTLMDQGFIAYMAVEPTWQGTGVGTLLLAAAEAVAGQVDVSAAGASLLPAVENLRASSATTAVAVARAAVADGVATAQRDNWVQAVQDAMWQPVYPGDLP